MLTMLIGGLWHGAGWTFVVWGGIHGTALCVERWWRGRPGFVERPWTRGRRAWHRFVTFQVVCFAWIFFRADSFADAWDLIQRLFTAWGEPSPLVTWGVLAAIAVGIGSQYLPRRLPLADHGALLPPPDPGAGRAFSRSPSSSSTPWAPRAWHRSSTSSSDGDARDHRDRTAPARAPREGGRRLHSAGSAIVVSLVGLAFALFLNAPGLHKSATIQPEGWKRDVALGVTGPLESVSGALFLDRPRRALKAALGRSRRRRRRHGCRGAAAAAADDDPSTPAETPAQARRSSRRSASSACGSPATRSSSSRASRSSARSPATARSAPSTAIDGRIASGLERPDVFNWFTHIARGDGEGQAAGRRTHVRRQRRPQLHDRASRRDARSAPSAARAGAPSTGAAWRA